MTAREIAEQIADLTEYDPGGPATFIEAITPIIAAALAAQQAEIEQAARCVVETFQRDEAQGYHSRDRQFAIDVLWRALSPTPASKED